MDLSAGKALYEKLSAISDVLIAEMKKTYVNTWDWIDMKFGDANLVTFSSGYGDGLYGTYAGFDSNGDVAVVVTDFNLIPLDDVPA